MGVVYFQGGRLASQTAQNSDFRAALGQPYPQYMKHRLDATYSYVAAGLGITAASAYAGLKTGVASRIARMGMIPSLLLFGTRQSPPPLSPFRPCTLQNCTFFLFLSSCVGFRVLLGVISVLLGVISILLDIILQLCCDLQASGQWFHSSPVV